jgi:NAD(P)-dependent dehydrogenase (short-subunit alcohol dehydrogenase family)
MTHPKPTQTQIHPSGKIALVTGGSRGLGRNIALALAWGGHDVVLTYRSKKDEADSVVTEIKALGMVAAALQIDTSVISSFGAFKATLLDVLNKTWQRDKFDFLVNNAGIDRQKPFVETTETDFDDLINVHFKGVYFLTQTLLPLMNDGGRIVNTSSGLARFSVPGYSAYGAMKGAVEVLTRYLAKELGSRGIGVNCVAPGIIETDFTKHTLSNPQAKTFLESNIALGRVGVPDDIGGVVAFLCSDAGRWVNGQRVEASGGMFL